jgi:hypothetical protein
MELVEEVKELLRETAKDLKGSARRLFMARAVHALGAGGQRLAERELGWSRGTIRKGQHERERGIVCLDAFSSRGRKRSEEHLPTLRQRILPPLWMGRVKRTRSFAQIVSTRA